MADKGIVSPEALAFEILSLSRSTLAVSLRFLDRALFRLEYKCTDRPHFASDGRRLYYEPWYILSQYRSDPTLITRDLLHLLMHLIYRHSFVGKGIDRTYWDLAADIAVENTINEMKKVSFSSARASRQWEYTELLRSEVGTLTAEKIYRWLAASGMAYSEAEELRRSFFGDEHGLWYEVDGEDCIVIDVNVRDDWEEISKRMETELDLLREDSSSPLIQNLRSLNRAKYDYSKFLRRFGEWSESLIISDEEFDNNYYTFGLNTYGNMPFIEPLEYSEQQTIRDFVIAIDTSGSVKGDVVQAFIQHTHDILSKRESFRSRINMHIIQCDDRIREDVLITCKEDFDAYISSMEIKGLGCTDFRPVFEYVDWLIASGELTSLRGLIYFTDGLGTFPARKPKYETAFILHRGDYDEPELPVWATHMVMSDEDVLNLGK